MTDIHPSSVRQFVRAVAVPPLEAEHQIEWLDSVHPAEWQ
jgi:hypothetical protein